MPIYNYKCDGCDYAYPLFRKIAARDECVGDVCPQCNQGKLFRPPEAGLGTGFTSSESLGRAKAPAEFRNLLSAIKKENPRSTIKER